MSALTHGHTKNGKWTPEYRTWSAMKERCGLVSSKAWKNYGARGIKVCDRWLDFSFFFADMGPKPSSAHSIDRIDNNGNYEPSNCRWASRAEQISNRRNTLRVDVDGQQVELRALSRLIGVGYRTLVARYHAGDRGAWLRRPADCGKRGHKQERNADGKFA